MKYWFYSEGNILGPYGAAEMLALPAFTEESLVCPESATGDNPGDWRPANQLAEIASALSVGVGRTVAAGVVGGTYEYETGFNSSVEYFANREPATGAGYGELLDTIDNILGAFKEGPDAPGQPPEADYDFSEKFDVRLSRIQEELEAARWEKNLLLEKMRLKEAEEKRNRARIEELELKLKSRPVKIYEVPAAASDEELREKTESFRQAEEIRREELSLREEAAPRPEPAAPRQLSAVPLEPKTAPSREEGLPASGLQARSFKSIKPAAEIRLSRTVNEEAKAGVEDSSLTSRRFRSLGQTQPPAYVYGSHYDKPLPGPEAAPAGAYRSEPSEPLPQQAGGIVYDFTVVTAKAPEVQQFSIEPRQEPQAAPQQVKPAPAPFQEPRPAPQPYQFQPEQQAAVAAPTPTFQQAPQDQHAYQFQPGAAARPAAALTPAPGPALQPAPAVAVEPEKTPEAAPDSPDKTQRLTLPLPKTKPAPQAGEEKPRKKGGRMAFVVILVIFGSIAAGGLGYFFLGEGVSFSEFSMLSVGTKKKASALPSQLEPKEEAAPVSPAAPAGVPEAQPAPAPAPQPQSESIKKAIDIVKNYKLSGGRGAIAGWFANSFLSNTGGANEEWTATPLHGDILVVQYRLLRPRQEPLVYQFEVDSAKEDIVRGINNNALDLLALSTGEKSVSAAPVKKAAPRKARKAAAHRELEILPLPDAPGADSGAGDPTGFENPGADSEQVRYLKAQESDEELF